MPQRTAQLSLPFKLKAANNQTRTPEGSDGHRSTSLNKSITIAFLDDTAHSIETDETT
jgi:hypothetical protein